jgi:hypothetical protein
MGIFGFGESYINTPVGTAGSQWSMYFRGSFTLCDAAAVTSMVFNATYDDGMTVYINGTQAVTAGVSGDPPAWNGGASSHESHQTYHSFNLYTSLDSLVNGINVIAVGTYNSSKTSSDLVFDGELIIDSNASATTLFTGNEVQAQSVDTTVWIPGIKTIEVSGDDVPCESPLFPTADVLAFESFDYYCDNDMDGTFSSSVSGTCTSPDCLPAECQINAGTDCDDLNSEINPGASDLCDNLDNNCDGSVDEDLTQPTTCGVGECAGNTGEETCTAGVWGNDTCDPFAGAVSESCDNLDNDCDGSIDENLTQATSCGAGACAAAGVETCTAGAWGGNTCTPGTPTAETCNNIDDNCNGSVDENLTQPTTCGVGECAGNTGDETCTAGVWGNDTCDPFAGAVSESCDNLDNDCDGSIDDGCDDDGDGYCDNNMTVSGAPVNECPGSLDGPGDDCNDSDPNIYPGGPAVRIVRIPPQYYSLFQESYNNSVSDEIIQIKNAQLTESIILDRNISLTLEAGYNCDFTISSGKVTVNGNLTVVEGMFIIQDGALELK